MGSNGYSPLRTQIGTQSYATPVICFTLRQMTYTVVYIVRCVTIVHVYCYELKWLTLYSKNKHLKHFMLMSS